MSKPNDDLSALFRSLRPDESVYKDNISSAARDAEQRWPLFKAVAPQKPQDVPVLSEQDRQRWVSQEKSAASVRKPALSLPGLSDKMSKSLGEISGQAVRNTSTVRPATRWEPQEHVVARASEQPLLRPSERIKTVLAEPAPLKNESVNHLSTVTKTSFKAPATDSRAGLDVLDKKSVPATPAPVPMPMTVQTVQVSQNDTPTSRRNDESLKSIFSRMQAKPEVEVKPVVKRSSFLDRLGKR